MYARSSARRTALAAALALASAEPLGAQPASGPVYDSYRRAYTIVARALEAHGGAAAVRGLRGIDYRYRGFTFDRDPGLRAASAYEPEPPRRAVTVRAAVDFTTPRQLTEFGIDAPGEGHVATRTVQRGREVLRFAPPAPGVSRTYTLDSLPAGMPASFPFQHQLMPVLVLRQAIVRSTTLRHLGRRAERGITEDLVSMSNADGSVLALGIDATTGLVSTVETVGEIGLFGDGDHVWRFAEYAASGGVQVPRAFQHRINGLLQEDMRLADVAVSPPWTDTSFAPPADYVLRPAATAARRAPGVVDSGGGVYFVEGLGGYRSMFVDVGDGIVAVEAPQNARVADQAIALIEKALPGKRITHLVLTHHHLDHVGGVHPYVERGAIVVAPVGMEDFLRRILGGTRTFGMLGQPARPTPTPRIEVVADRRRIGLVELIHATTSHAADMLVAYVPGRRLLFQGDLLQVDEGASAPRATQGAADLAALIERHALDVQTIASVHGRNATMADLRAALPPSGAIRR
jgi:glyoxylase-like metal-dependent hydrolase (beta-lactamase superfamily II)